MELFSKEEIIFKVQALRKAYGPDAFRADLNMALGILGWALIDKKLKSGEDYGLHPIHVGMSNTRSNTKRIIGILHDVVEDSFWDLESLEFVGFSKRIVDAVDGLTHREDEYYFDSIKRCSLNKDSVDKKIEDLSHNLDQSRNNLLLNNKDIERIQKYKISLAYLVDIKKGKIEAGSPIIDFIKTSPDFIEQENIALQIVEKFSDKENKDNEINTVSLKTNFPK